MKGSSDDVGIYFLDGENPNAPPNGISQVISYAETLPGVKLVKDYLNGNSRELTPEHLTDEIMENKLGRIILAGRMPGFYKSVFTRAAADAANGNGRADITLADFTTDGTAIENPVDRGKAVVACAYYDVPYDSAVMTEETEVNPETLVIGGGIAGIQAALEIANAKQKVYLLEKTGTIGGHMAMFDKTFPTLDCAACILTPKMVEVGQHPHIDLMSYCEVESVSGEPGNYTVKILKKARRVDIATCIGCGVCSEKCPGNTSSEFDTGTTRRKAIYIPFPQAVPNKYLVDEANCLYCQSDGKKCGVCVKVCPADAVKLDEKDETVEITVGNIVVATGFQVFDAARAEQFGYGKFPNVVTSLEFERLVNAGGPTGGNILGREKDKKGHPVFLPTGKAPESIALVHCIGSRDENYNQYCSKVCCMYSLKLAHLVKEKLPLADVYEYYIDMRAFGKGYEEFYERIKEEGINVIRGKTAKVEQNNGKLSLRTEDMREDQIIEQDVDMVVLAVGLEPRPDAGKIAEMLGLSRDEGGWFKENDYNTAPVKTFAGGITIAGTCQGPKDIPDTVAQASAAAADVLQNICRGKVNKNVSHLPFDAIEARVKELSPINRSES